MRWGECEEGGRDFTVGCCKSLNPLRRRPGRHASVLYYLLPFLDRFVRAVFDFRVPALCIEVAMSLQFVSFGVAFAHLSQGVKDIPLSIAFGRVLPSATIVAWGSLCRDTYPQQCGYTTAANGCRSVLSRFR